MNRVPVTREGYEALKKELENLKRVERPQNLKAIEEARAHGDLSENAEFAAAKDRQGFIEGRIGELGFKLANADIINPDKLPKDRAVFGHRVLLENIDTGEDVEYQLVGPDESDCEEEGLLGGGEFFHALDGATGDRAVDHIVVVLGLHDFGGGRTHAIDGGLLLPLLLHTREDGLVLLPRLLRIATGSLRPVIRL